MKQLLESYVKVNEILDKWDNDINELSKSTAKAYRDLISNPASYTNQQTKEEINKVVSLFDRLLNEYSINYDNEKNLFKDYSHYHAASVMQLIFNGPKGYMELTPMFDGLTDEAKKEIKNIENLHDIIDYSYQEMTEKLYTFAKKTKLPIRIDADDLKRKEKGLPGELLK